MASLRPNMLVRSFSTSISTLQMVKPKLQVFGMDGRYAMALFSAASKKKVLNDVETDLKTMQGLLKTDVRLKEFLLSPLLSKDLKKAAIDSVIQKKKMNALTGNLLACLTENGRIREVESVMSTFSKIMAAERGEVICEVTTAKEVDAAMKKEVETVLKGFLQKGETINLTLKVDPTIIGGMLVAIGDKFVDMSIASKINKYTSLLQEAV